MKKALIIGGGFAGCAMAHILELQGGWDVTIVEQGKELGAGVRTKWYGGHPYTFGPRHFLTKNEEVYKFLNKYCPLRLCGDHVFQSYVETDGNFYNYPIHVDDISRMPEQKKILEELNVVDKTIDSKPNNFEEYWISAIGPTMYEKFIKQYSKKMWQVKDNREIDTFSWSPKGVSLKSGPKEAWNEAISAYPYAPDGYDQYFNISTKAAKVLLNTTISDYDILQKTFVINGNKLKYDAVINTISPDLIMNSEFGTLAYVGREFHVFVLPIKFAFPENVYFLYYTGSEKLTRLVEYKKFTKQKYDENSTIIGMEIPVIDGGRHYPLPIQSEINKAQKYFDQMPQNVFSIGRAGSYDYSVDIDDCIAQAMEVGKKLL
jgi:UDP-galactopyranose mutase